jgi:DNA modification methylase
LGLPAAYYSDSLVQVYLGDSREIVPLLPQADLLLTDPPYGIGGWSASGGNSLGQDEADAINGWDVAPDPETLRMVVAHAKYAVVWGGNFLCGALGPWHSPLVWDKRNRGMHYADGEIAWTNFAFGTLRILELPLQATEVRGHRKHPTQKPVALMTWCIEQSKTTGLILDPFLGSGSTLVAAKLMNRRAIGIECVEAYAEVAAERCRQNVLGLL